MTIIANMEFYTLWRCFKNPDDKKTFPSSKSFEDLLPAQHIWMKINTKENSLGRGKTVPEAMVEMKKEWRAQEKVNSWTKCKNKGSLTMQNNRSAKHSLWKMMSLQGFKYM